MSPRHQTQDERDLEGLEAKRARELAAPHEVDRDDTSEIELPAERQRIRATRSPVQRIERLEERMDGAVDIIGELREKVGEVSGKLDVLPDLVDAVRESAKRAAEREHVTFTAQVDVDKAKALGKLDAEKHKRERVTISYRAIGTGLTALLGSGFLGALIAHGAHC